MTAAKAFERMVEVQELLALLAEPDEISVADVALFVRLTGEFSMVYGYRLALDVGMTVDQAMGVAPILADELERSVASELQEAGIS